MGEMLGSLSEHCFKEGQRQMRSRQNLELLLLNRAISSGRRRSWNLPTWRAMGSYRIFLESPKNCFLLEKAHSNSTLVTTSSSKSWCRILLDSMQQVLEKLTYCLPIVLYQRIQELLAGLKAHREHQVHRSPRQILFPNFVSILSNSHFPFV